jgi:hypothetical protein
VSKLCAWLGFPARGANITGRLRWVGTELRKSSFRSPATVPQSREHPWAWRLNRYWRAGHGCMWGVSRCSARGVLHVCWGAEMRTKRATSSGAKLNRTTTRIAEFDLESSPTQFRAQRDAKYEVFLAVRVERTYKCRCCGEMGGAGQHNQRNHASEISGSRFYSRSPLTAYQVCKVSMEATWLLIQKLSLPCRGWFPVTLCRESVIAPSKIHQRRVQATLNFVNNCED